MPGGTLTETQEFDGNDHPRLLIVDDCRLRRESLANALSSSGLSVQTAWDGGSLSAAEVLGPPPEVALVSMTNYEANSLLRRCVEIFSASRVIVFGLSEDDEELIVRCAEAGVAGFHLRSDSLGDLREVLRQVRDGELASSAKISVVLLRRMSELAAQPHCGGDSALTAREAEVLQLISTGLSNKEIAARLCIAVHTVKNHVHNLLTKIGARSRAEAVALYRDGADEFRRPRQRGQVPTRSGSLTVRAATPARR